MRIISGIAGGIRLNAPPGRDVRPTSDRVKEALFASLGDIRSWRVADFFSGSGALGIEALSRGAGHVTFVERDSRAFACIRANLSAFTTAGGETCVPDVTLLKGDVSAVPRRLPGQSGTFDLILADPPYHTRPGSYGACEFLLDPEMARWSGNALLVLEHETGTELPWYPLSSWGLLKIRRFGIRSIAFARLRPLQKNEDTGTVKRT